MDVLVKPAATPACRVMIVDAPVPMRRLCAAMLSLDGMAACVKKLYEGRRV